MGWSLTKVLNRGSEEWDKYTGAAGQEGANKTNLQIAQETNAQNKDIFEQNLQFQERMSNTAYQRGTADMKKAGINPALAFSKGGASSPSGASANMIPATMQNPDSNVSNAVATAVQFARTLTEVDNIRADTEKKITETGSTEADQEKKKFYKRLWGLGNSVFGAIDNSAKDAIQNQEKKSAKEKMTDDLMKIEIFK